MDGEIDVNTAQFDALMDRYRVWQQPQEWRFFIEFIEAYFRNRDIRHPVIVELGTAGNSQKIFYETLLEAQHIGIDISNRRGQPDILGDTHSASTFNKLKSMLQGKSINLLFIDAGHDYQDVKADYEMYAPLTEDIVAFHDIKLQREQVRIFWDEVSKAERDRIKIVFYGWNAPEKIIMGIGLLIRRPS